MKINTALFDMEINNISYLICDEIGLNEKKQRDIKSILVAYAEKAIELCEEDEKTKQEAIAEMKALAEERDPSVTQEYTVTELMVKIEDWIAKLEG